MHVRIRFSFMTWIFFASCRLRWEKIRSSLEHGVSSGYAGGGMHATVTHGACICFVQSPFAIFETCVLFTLPHHHASVKPFILVLFMHS